MKTHPLQASGLRQCPVTVALFTGMRISELLGLTWDSVDMERGTITIDKQLSHFNAQKTALFTTPKSGKPRTLTPAAPSSTPGRPCAQTEEKAHPAD